MLMANGTIRPKARVGGHIALALLLLMACASAKAQKEKACLISVGHVDILDTYLSQEKATGLELRYNKEMLNRKRVACGDTASTRLRKWSTFVSQEALVSKAGTRGNSNSFLCAMYNLRLGWHYNVDRSRLNVRFGLLGDFTLGGIYNTRNSNNPAQLKLALSVAPSVMAIWRFSVKGKPLALRYEASVPVAGLAFSPKLLRDFHAWQLRPQRGVHLAGLGPPDSATALARLPALAHHIHRGLSQRHKAVERQQLEVSSIHPRGDNRMEVLTHEKSD